MMFGVGGASEGATICSGITHKSSYECDSGRGQVCVSTICPRSPWSLTLYQLSCVCVLRSQRPPYSSSTRPATTSSLLPGAR